MATDALIALASGVPLVVLGGLLLALRPRLSDSAFFGLAAVLWGLQVISANLGRVLGSGPVHHAGLLVSFSLLAPTSLFLVHSMVLTHSGVWTRRVPPIAWSVLGGLTALVLLVRPDWVVAGVQEEGGRLSSTTMGPVFPLLTLPFYAAFYAAIASTYSRYRAAAPGSPRHRVRGVLLALALYASYATVRNLFVFIDPPPSIRLLGPLGSLPSTLVFLLGCLLLAGIVAHLLLRPPPPRELDAALAMAFLVPAGVALLETALERNGIVFDSVGAWRLATVAALVFALARHQLFDLDVRLKQVVGPGASCLLFGFGLLGAIVLFVQGRETAVALVPLMIGLVGAGAAWSVRDKMGEFFFPGIEATPNYLYRRRLDVYGASLERVLAKPGPDEEAKLRRLRDQLGITQKEHEVLAYALARAAPVVHPGRKPQDPAAARLLLGRYRIDRLLGEGAHGRSFLAHDEQDDRPVVVKFVGTSLLGERGAQMLLREARVARSLQHPNIVTVLEAGEGAHEAYLVMEYAEEGSLQQVLDRRGGLSLEDAGTMLDQVLAALEEAHAHGVVHRDVKPANILVARDGIYKLADFGVARQGQREVTGITGGQVGTLVYMSPEQVRGLPADGRSDLYAAAVVFHQALSNRFYLPLAGRDDYQVRRAILQGRPRLELRGQPPWVRALLARALAKSPQRRFQTAQDMRRVLRDGLRTPAGGGQRLQFSTQSTERGNPHRRPG